MPDRRYHNVLAAKLILFPDKRKHLTDHQDQRFNLIDEWRPITQIIYPFLPFNTWTPYE